MKYENHPKIVMNLALAAVACGVALGQGKTGMQSVYNAYWSTAGGFQSLAQLHNNSVKAPITVQPTIYIADGQSIWLDAVTLVPLGNATIDIGAELTAKGWGQSTAGSAVFQYQGKVSGMLGVEVYEGNSARSLSFTIPSTEKPYASAVQNAVFWLPSHNADIYVSLQNTSNQPIHVTPSVSLNGAQEPLAAVPLAPWGSSVVYISGSLFQPGAWQKNATGGISVTQDGPPGALNTGAWIEDDSVGFSTTLTFANPAVKGTGLIGTQILVGSAGLAFGLPPNFVISSHLVLRNVSAQPTDVQGTLTFSDNNGGIAAAALPSLHLAAGQVTGVDLGQVKAQGGVPPQFVSASISLQYSGASGALMGRVFGISADGSYGLYWALQPSAGKVYSESFWSTQGNWSPIFTVGNFAATADQITVVLTSNHGTYTLPVLNLQPLESRTINIRQLLATANPFPPGVDFGGFRISGASSASKFMVKEHLVDPIDELATPFYGGYQYAEAAWFYENVTDYDNGGNPELPVGYGTGIVIQMGVTMSGEPDDYESATPDGSEYGSFNTSIATLTFTGGAGTLTGVAAGTASIWADTYQTIDSEGDEGDIGTDGDVEADVCDYQITPGQFNASACVYNGSLFTASFTLRFTSASPSSCIFVSTGSNSCQASTTEFLTLADLTTGPEACTTYSVMSSQVNGTVKYYATGEDDNGYAGYINLAITQRVNSSNVSKTPSIAVTCPQ
jgi:hypothetical protein